MKRFETKNYIVRQNASTQKAQQIFTNGNGRFVGAAGAHVWRVAERCRSSAGAARACSTSLASLSATLLASAAVGVARCARRAAGRRCARRSASSRQPRVRRELDSHWIGTVKTVPAPPQDHSTLDVLQVRLAVADWAPVMCLPRWTSRFPRWGLCLSGHRWERRR